jgi:hypothetical protein
MGWTLMPGWATDIAVGPDGSVFHSGRDGLIYKWNGKRLGLSPCGTLGHWAVGISWRVFYTHISRSKRPTLGSEFTGSYLPV